MVADACSWGNGFLHQRGGEGVLGYRNYRGVEMLDVSSGLKIFFLSASGCKYLQLTARKCEVWLAAKAVSGGG
jgi:hypothetical protein